MKTNFLRLSILLIAMSSAVLVSCSDDDDYVPGDVLVEALNTIYPDAQKVSWETKNEYKVAEFILENKEREVWFDVTGNWLMTETDLPFNELPLAVQESFLTGTYGAWTVDDVDMIERYNTETIYIIEAEKGEQEVDLHYTADGTLVKEILDADDDDKAQSHQPVEMTTSISEFIASKYVGAKILEYDQENNGIEVDIVHNQIHKGIFLFGRQEIGKPTYRNAERSQVRTLGVSFRKGAVFSRSSRLKY